MDDVDTGVFRAAAFGGFALCIDGVPELVDVDGEAKDYCCAKDLESANGEESDRCHLVSGMFGESECVLKLARYASYYLVC